MSIYPGKNKIGRKNVVVRPSSIKGRGLFARRLLVLGAWICQYPGIIHICPSKGPKTRKLAKKYKHVELVTISPGKILEGYTSNNYARYANHSCKPNAKILVINKKEGAVWLNAIADIAEGEEITVSYGKNFFGLPLCQCPSCKKNTKGALREMKQLSKKAGIK